MMKRDAFALIGFTRTSVSIVARALRSTETKLEGVDCSRSGLLALWLIRSSCGANASQRYLGWLDAIFAWFDALLPLLIAAVVGAPSFLIFALYRHHKAKVEAGR